MKVDFIQIDDGLVRRDCITRVDTTRFDEEGVILIRCGEHAAQASALRAYEALMLLKPSVLEGLRLRYGKGAWIAHNVLAHPLMQFMALGAMLVQPLSSGAASVVYDAAIAIHDATVPMPRGRKLRRAKTVASQSNATPLVKRAFFRSEPQLKVLYHG